MNNQGLCVDNLVSRLNIFNLRLQIDSGDGMGWVIFQKNKRMKGVKL